MVEEVQTRELKTLEKPSQSSSKVVDVRTLLGPIEALTIQHGQRRYVLRLTRKNNLILTRDESFKSGDGEK